MIRRASTWVGAPLSRVPPVLLLIITGGLLFGSACSKEEQPQSIPVPSGAPSAAPVAADTSTAANTAAPAPSAVAPAVDTAATPQPGINTKAQQQAGASIEPCCAALNTMSVLSGKSAESKAKAGAASKACYGIAKLVKDGKTSKAAAMAQIRSSLGDVSPPPECN
jgi:hypothetical protein